MVQRNKLHLTDNALEVLRRRYLLKDNQGRAIETPEELFRRVANHIADADRNFGAADDSIEKTAEQFYQMMISMEFMPNSPTLMNAGRPLGQLSACFVLPVGDSMEEIFETNKHAAIIHKSGGGTGFSFSRLRPRNSIVASTSGVASGPVSFMKVFNASTEAVRQGGTRRGANMGILRVDHPDINEFISCKDRTGEITNFNISVGITDTFIAALKAGGTYPLLNPHTGRTHTIDGKEIHLKASDIFSSIVKHAWQTGEPGIVFIDRMNAGNPTHPSETIEATNPCGEQPLPPYDSCNLGSINLSRFVKDSLPDNYTPSDPSSAIDWNALGHVVRRSVHFLDNVIEQNRYPFPAIKKQTLKNRRIGLGVMGWADMLVRLGIPYNHDLAFELGQKVMGFVQSEGHKHSSELAKSRGKFPNWEGSIYAEQSVSMRNATVTTVAPTGTISIIAGCSSGIEPYYAIAFQRNVMDGTKLMEINALFKQTARRLGFDSESLAERLLGHRSIKDISGIPDEVKAVFLTAADITPGDHIRMQAAFQQECDSSVSKTINFPEKATHADVREAFELAYELNCKGVTIYRDNSRPHQVLSSISSEATEPASALKVEERPRILHGITEKIKTGYGNLYVTVNTHNGHPFEVFAQIGKSGYTTTADTEAICRLISLALRSGVEVDTVIRQLRGIGGSQPVFAGGSKISSIPDAIAQILNRHFGSGESADRPNEPSEICPECSGGLVLASGCFSCASCGYSNC